jgi:hypothetical protein
MPTEPKIDLVVPPSSGIEAVMNVIGPGMPANDSPPS